MNHAQRDSPNQPDASPHGVRPADRLKRALLLLHTGTDHSEVTRLTGFPLEVIDYLADPQQAPPTPDAPPSHRWIPRWRHQG